MPECAHGRNRTLATSSKRDSAGRVVGHVHLKVADLDRAFRVFVRVLKFAIPVFLICVALPSCASPPAAEEFEVGMSKAELREDFGEPVRADTLIKNEHNIWGPIETFWVSMEIGDTVETWSYSSPGGYVELYFVNGSDRVNGTGFHPEGAVY